jgi:hypothetical protein
VLLGSFFSYETAPDFTGRTERAHPAEDGAARFHIRTFDFFRSASYNGCRTTKEERPIGLWGQQHRRYLREYKRAVYTALLLSGKLNGYLADIGQQAEEMFFRLVKQMAEREGITEQLKADDPMAWVRRMNNIQACVTEIVNQELIYA